MAAIKLQRLKDIILRAYEAGYNGCLDLKDEYAEEALVEWSLLKFDAPKMIRVATGEFTRQMNCEKNPLGPCLSMCDLAKAGLKEPPRKTRE